LGFAAFGVTSVGEKEWRAASMAFVAAVVAVVVLALLAWLPSPARWVASGLVAGLVVVTVILFLLPIGRVERAVEVPTGRIDERDIMFARARLEPGSPNYEAYYALRLGNKESDDKTRSLPGLFALDATEANAPVFAATETVFGLIDTLQGAVDGPVAPRRVEHDAADMTQYIKGLAQYLGAHSVGIAELRPYHVYTHIGRGPGEYGAPVVLKHGYAIAFTVEMDQAMVGTAPAAPTLLESAHQYANAAQIAIQLGAYIRSQGYAARAHIDANYRVVAPLVARDAGLGEIGRMGLLMTPTLGPRVRLGVVTTDLDLEPDRRTNGEPVLDFCRVCQKCADNCPVTAIPYGDRAEIDGVLRWRIDQDLCYRYWCVVGTDCARCMALCPYSYPDSPVHNVVRWGVQRSGFARRLVIWLDRVFYGPAPGPKPAPSWVPRKPD
jgi:ferredoxin